MREPWRAAEAWHNEKVLAKGQLQQQLKGSCREAEAETMRSPGEVQRCECSPTVADPSALESQHHRRTTKDSSRSGASLRPEDKLCVQERVEPPGWGNPRDGE